MHATYCFLVNVEDEEENILHDAEVIFEREYLDGFGDENNWHTIHELILEDGRVFLPDGLESAFDKAEADQKFDLAIKHALLCTINEIYFCNLPEFNPRFESGTKSKDDIIKIMLKCFPDMLDKATKDVQKMFTEDMDDIHYSSEIYRLNKIISCLTGFCSSEVKPFSQNLVSPYEYRCFDLTHGEDGNRGILFVDIHT